VRLDPAVRREQLIEATFRCLCRSGTEAGIRDIAAEAGLSIGMVRHHFQGKDELLAATYRALSDRLQAEAERALAAAGPDPQARLWAFVTAGLHPPILERDYIRVRFLLWGLSHSNEAVRRAHDAIYDRFRHHLETLIGAAAAARGVQVDSRGPALAVMALLKGVWLEWSLSPETVEPERLVEQVLPLLTRALR